MRNITTLRIAIKTAALMLYLLPETLSALPDFASETNARCAACHAVPVDLQPIDHLWGGLYDGSIVEGKFQITPQAKTIDLGTQLDGQTLGPLEAFEANSGDAIVLSVDIIDGETIHALALRGLENGGQKNSQENKLSYEYQGDNYWIVQPTYSNPSIEYIYSQVEDDQPAGSRTLSLKINDNTPADVYQLTFSMGLRNSSRLSYEEHSFYLDLSSSTHVLANRIPLRLSKTSVGYAIQFERTPDLNTMTLSLQESQNLSSWNELAQSVNGSLFELSDQNPTGLSINEENGLIEITVPLLNSDLQAYRIFGF